MSNRDDNEPRVCPNCGEARSDSDFKSAHPLTHCNACHAAKDRTREEHADVEAPAAAAAPTPDDSEDRRASRAQAARHKRLAARRLDVDLCPVTGIELDVADDCSPEVRPARAGGVWMSAIAARIVKAGVSPEALERAAAWLRERAEG